MRCKACDNVMKPGEIVWLQEWGIWEDCCRVCKYIAFSGESPIVGDEDETPSTHSPQ